MHKFCLIFRFEKKNTVELMTYMSNFAEYISSQLIKHGNIMSLLFLLKHPNLNRVNLGSFRQGGITQKRLNSFETVISAMFGVIERYIDIHPTVCMYITSAYRSALCVFTYKGTTVFKICNLPRASCLERNTHKK